MRARALVLPALAAMLMTSAPPAAAKGGVVQPPPASADSACVARGLPLGASFLFAGLSEAVADARRWAYSPPLPPRAATFRAIKLTLGWSAALLLLGLGVLVFAPEKLRRITDTLSSDPGKALTTGLLVDFATLPVLAILLILLAVTLIGILLIPFAIVAFVLLWMGIAALGFFAVAQVLGVALMGPRREAMTQRGVALGGLLTGLLVLQVPWLLAAIATWSTTPALVLRAIAVTITAVAVTAGLGAVARAHRAVPGGGDYVPAPTHTREELAWQTPTPVGGVVAAKRPVKAP